LRVDKEAKKNQTIFRYIHLNFHSHHWHEQKFFTAIIQKKTHQYPDSGGIRQDVFTNTEVKWFLPSFWLFFHPTTKTTSNNVADFPEKTNSK
jgi:hypothetical protein